MNLNFGRTIMGVLAGVSLAVPIIAQVIGCEVDDPATAVVEATTCAASWLPTGWATVAAFGFVAVGGVMKLFKSGNWFENLFAPSAPIVDPAVARPGVVTMAQVKAGSGKH